MDRGTWRATVHGVTKNQTQLSIHVIRIELVISHKETKKLQMFKKKKAIWTPFHGPLVNLLVSSWPLWQEKWARLGVTARLVVKKLVTGPQSSESRHLIPSKQSCFCHLDLVTPAGDGLCPIVNFLSWQGSQIRTQDHSYMRVKEKYFSASQPFQYRRSKERGGIDAADYTQHGHSGGKRMKDQPYSNAFFHFYLMWKLRRLRAVRFQIN